MLYLFSPAKFLANILLGNSFQAIRHCSSERSLFFSCNSFTPSKTASQEAAGVIWLFIDKQSDVNSLCDFYTLTVRNRRKPTLHSWLLSI